MQNNKKIRKGANTFSHHCMYLFDAQDFFLLLAMLKTVVLLNIFVETKIRFLMNIKFKRTAFI